MATAILVAVIGKLAGAVVGKLGEMALEQVADQKSLLLNFRKDFEWLESNLTSVTGYLQYADDLCTKNKAVKKWLADVQHIGFDAQDMVEECAVQPLYGDSCIFRYKMGRRIRKLKGRIESIMKDAVNLTLVQQVFHAGQALPSDDRGQEWKKSGLLERDAWPVAIEAKVERILKLLEEDALQVIAVVGMGGIGKTFLLQNVYKHHKVLQRFEKAIWLSISQVYSVAKLQCDIASHFGLDIKAYGVTQQRAAELIQERLREESSFIVLDDVWRVEGVHNLLQMLGIPCGTTNPCKVVITTRSIEVCNIMGASQIYQMELLSESDSWNLFRLHGFPNDQQNRPSKELEKVAHQVERECGRLPLAIKTVAASMANHKLLSIWQSKLRHLKEVSDPQELIRPILRSSYDALPAVLKLCFLYFSFFGVDVVIDAEYLIYLWIGEGFIPEGKEQWSTGWNYLKQLNNFCLVDVNEDDELKKTCKVHDLLLDLTIHISKKNKCAFTIEEASGIGCRRILLAKKGLEDADISLFKCPPSLRTLSLSQNLLIRKLPSKSLSHARALRVIDLSLTDISLLPRCIADFKLLRVLNLSNTGGFKEVPNCVRKVKSLCYLDVRTCPLPKWIGNLKCLQHLHVYRVDYSSEISKGISKLVSLRTFRSESDSELVLKDVAKLIQLQEVRIDIANEEQISLQEGVLAQLVNMRHLHIQTYRQTFPENMKVMKDLEYVRLHGFTVPIWICEYGNLRVLQLRFCDWSACPAFETMPNLMNLNLTYCQCQKLPESFGKSGAFPQLRTLVINGCSRLEKLPGLQHGAMPCVKVFSVSTCDRLQKIPGGLEHLRSLKHLELSHNNLTEEEIGKLEEGGEYWKRIKANNSDVTIAM